MNLYCIHSELDEQDKECISSFNPSERIKYNFLEIDKELFSSFPTVKRYPVEIYYRLFAFRLLPIDMERILYLDVDIIVKGSIDALYNMSFDNKMLIATTHINKLMTFINKLRLGVFGKGYIYANSGVMLMNLPIMRETINENDIVKFIRRRKLLMTLYDQDVIFGLYGNKIGLVSSKIYNLSDREIKLNNMMSKNKIDFQWVEKNNIIIHYIGKNKPWKKGYQGILGVYYSKYEKASASK